MLYIPYLNFEESHINKATSSIPLGFRDAGYESHIIVGVMESKNYKKLGINVHETGNSDIKYLVQRGDRLRLIPRLRNFMDFNEFAKVYKILIREKPDIFMAYNNSILTGFIVLAYRIRFNRHKAHPILKLDSDGSEFVNMVSFRKSLFEISSSSLSIVFDRIIVESSCGLRAFSNIPVFGKKLITVPNSISHEYMEDSVEMERKKNIITVSRIAKEKNIEMLIETFAAIAMKFPDWNLEIIGPITDEQYYGSLKNLVKKYGMEKRILFTGAVNTDQLRDKYSTSSIFCLFSLNEGFPIARLEAIASGMYVISTGAGCASDSLKYGIHIVPDNNIEIAAEEISNGIRSIENHEYIFERKKMLSYKELALKIIDEVNND